VATFSGFSTNVLITFVSPYLQDTGYGNLQGKIGFVWGAGSIIAVAWAFFMLPELKGRTLEEMDELFQKHISVFEFGKYQTSGAGAHLAIIEGLAHQNMDEKVAALFEEDSMDKEKESAIA
jgi:SP family sugar:H+ symporter-like MFS transporter